MDPALERCGNCAAALEATVRCPVTTRRDESGRLLLFAFCDEACKREWEAADAAGEPPTGGAPEARRRLEGK